MKNKVIKCVKAFGIGAIWIGIWYLLCYIVSDPLLLPPLHAVILRLFEIMRTVDFYEIIARSIVRILIGLVFATVSGVLLAIVSAKFKLFHSFLVPFMTALKVTPVASFIILLLLWIGRDVAPAIISVCVVLPVVWTGVETGILQTDKRLLEMSRAYNMGFVQKLKYIYIPSTLPYFISSLKSSIGIAWKAGIAAEVISQPLISIGKQINESKLNLETTDLFVWTLVAVIISVIIESGMVFVTKKIANAKKDSNKESVAV